MIQRRTPLRRVSKKRRGENAYYAKKRKEFLARFPLCAVARELFNRDLPATQIHHREGRIGARYLDESTWLPVSAYGHEWIHRHPAQSREKGWIRTPTGAELMKARAER